MSPSDLRKPHTVTFDCWATLIHDADGRGRLEARAGLIAEFARVDEERALDALRKAWRRHQMLWHRRVAFTGAHMTAFVLESLGTALPEGRVGELNEALESEILTHEIRPLPGARESLEALAAAGVRRALICDTGYAPGRIVRQLLERVGLLEFLEVTVFSDEIGVPKPHPRAFATALEGLGMSARGAVHVGDLRRSDVAGARAHGMGSIRLILHHDDTGTGPGPNAGVIDCAAAGCEPACERPEADAVAASYAEVMKLVGYIDEQSSGE